YAEPTFVEPALDDDAVSSLGTDLASFVAAGTVEAPVEVDFSVGAADQSETVAEIDTAGAVEDVDVAEPVAEIGDAGETADADADADDDLASQLSQLSPKAAAALEATWGDAEPAAGGGDEIDQNLLLRFLSSTKT